MDYSFSPLSHVARRKDLVDFVVATVGAAVVNRSPLEVCERIGASDRTKHLIKAGLTTGSALLPTGDSLSADFVAAQAAFSAVDAIFSTGAFRPLPARTKIVANSAIIVAAETGNGAMVPVRSLLLDAASNPLREAAAIIAISSQVWTSTSDAARGLIEAELRSAAAQALDTVFFAMLLTTATPEVDAASDTFAGAWRRALAEILVTPTSRIVAVASPDVAAFIAGIPADGVGLAYPTIGPAGGKIGLIPVFVSVALPADGMVIFDADAIGFDPGTIEIGVAQHADLVMQDAPAGGPAQVVSLWQTNTLAAKVLRRFAATKIREAACQIVNIETTVS